ncbi:MAG: hypothetical protein A2289_20810 [Deltaproteobacteria bacterium RIFOXYA12_FULL_58_15]|nr:MAG: hypothetical protein A2289_20810 [Deltaproteobacteria bacterium RIFOXYA12_FULL_58_15]OGR11780.1 MAG: hypothetical protein A2341_02535 [Deltaproteobacteria bacterium RIFOXYB12_FULL_58_9]
MRPQELQASLQSIDGWKRICKPFLLILGGAKKSFAKWSTGAPKGVYTNHTLAEFEHEDSKYAIYAFCNQRELNEAKLAELRSAAAGVPLGTVRYESLSYSGLEPWRGQGGSLADENGSIAALGSLEQGLFVYPVADGIPHPLVVYAFCDGAHCIFPVPAKRL